ncbi:SAM-dependent methyltransferase [Amycolatopsis pithecellobii]|uniref:SAM-dependent methyltransferase n=1 Tax=Amycolatopsis pithecellobii TaxID=664692 RepID=UPI001407DA78|nr:SAM-dependent methyltransferase [Amycolatopsis pithecellobii]
MIARANHVWLTGLRDQPEVAVDFADNVALVAPHIPHLIRTQRHMLGRMVRYLVGQGIRQFLDLGSGLPTGNHVHQVAQAVDPNCRVVYVDNEPGLAKDGQKLVAGNDRVGYLCLDIRRVDSVLGDRETHRLIDFDQPVAVLLIATLLHIPDEDDPNQLVSRYVNAVPSGSYLGISHFDDSPAIQAGYTMFERMRLGERPQPYLRGPDRQKALFEGLDLIEPGIVPLPLWRPNPDDVTDRNPDRAHAYAGLGRKR